MQMLKASLPRAEPHRPHGPRFQADREPDEALEGRVGPEGRHDGAQVSYSFTVSPNTTATILLPGEKPRRVGSGVYAFTQSR